MSLPTKLLSGLFLFFLALLIIHYSLFIKLTHAQVPEGNQPCNVNGADPEFHSLRPYQASPCNPAVEDVALFCGNDLVVVQGLTVNKSRATFCHSEGSKEVCEFKGIEGGGPIAIDLTGATLPIAGNTELVANSQDTKAELEKRGDYLDFADRVNEYANWYLQGAAYKAEEAWGNPFEAGGLAEHLIVNYSGPIRKLLPRSKIFDEQTKTVEDAKDTQHNQIVVCEGGIFGWDISWDRLLKNPVLDIFAAVFAPDWAKDLLSWHFIPRLNVSGTGDCYSGNGAKARNEYRLTDWEGEFPARVALDFLLNIAVDIGTNVANFFGGFFGLNFDAARDYVQENLANAYKPKLPPDENAPEYLGQRLKFLKDYNEWRGRRCAIIPIPIVDSVFGKEIRFLFCTPELADITVSADIANFFAYVPFSSNEDRVGEVDIDKYSVYPASPNLTIYNVAVTGRDGGSGPDAAKLFFPHMEAINEHADILQSLFAPSGIEKTGAKNTASIEPYCDIANVRTNPGDDLFAGEIFANLSYLADFTCEFSVQESSGDRCGDDIPFGFNDCPVDGEVCVNNRCVLQGNPSCTKNVAVNLSTVTKTPLAEEVWQKLVYGPASVFKRIFPKVEAGGAIEGILDIPASTNVTYSGADVVAGDPGKNRSGSAAELYFPHLGSVSEYFLRGIQTILRPKGFGEQILSGQPGTIPTPPPLGEIDCNQNAPEANVPGIISKADFVELAKRLRPDAADTTNAEYCYNDVIAKARAKGINPAYALVTWLLESNASNYAISDQDFGIDKVEVRGFTDQITHYLSTVSGFYSSCVAEPFWQDEMEATLYMYRTGDCYKDGNADGLTYYNAVKAHWQMVAPGCSFPTSPGQNTCR